MARIGMLLYIALMVAVIAGVDITYLEHEFWRRLLANICIVIFFAAIYFTFIRRD